MANIGILGKRFIGISLSKRKYWSGRISIILCVLPAFAKAWAVNSIRYRMSAFQIYLPETGQSGNGPIAVGPKRAPIVVIPKVDARSWKLPLPELNAAKP